MNKWKGYLQNATLTQKIQYSYLLILIPFICLQALSIFYLKMMNDRYDKMIESSVVASEFSLDFKKDFDYETYLVIVGNKSMEESELNGLLMDAKRVVGALGSKSDSKNNAKRLESISKYLNNLETYKDRIEENLKQEGQYETNLLIWENDVQIVTSLVQESMSEYIYYEIRDIERLRQENQRVYMRLLRITFCAVIVILALTFFTSYYIPRGITKPILSICKVTEQVAGGDLSVRSNESSGAEVTMLSESLNAMIDKINMLLEQVTEEQVRLRKAELELLQSQINPHFLYNTLDTIIWLAEAGNQEMVVKMVGSLSDFFKASLSEGQDIISIEKELVHVRSYLEIQQTRYQDILQYEIHISEDVYGCKIPKITLQPLIENALYHGIKNKRGLGTITVSGGLCERGVELIIRDNGIGMPPERLQQVQEKIKHRSNEDTEIYGLYNVNERITLQFGDAYGIEIESEYQEGTVAKVYLPKN